MKPPFRHRSQTMKAMTTTRDRLLSRRTFETGEQKGAVLRLQMVLDRAHVVSGMFRSRREASRPRILTS